MTAHRTITFAGKVYTCPFSLSFRRHTEEEALAMSESVRLRGIHNPVRVYRDTTLGLSGCVLDGEGRLSTAVLLDLPADRVPLVDLGPLSTADAYALALDLNDARRHEDPEAVRRRRAERIARVVAARTGGKSYRAIAREVGVSEAQVRADLDRHAGSAGAVEPPDRVTGTDGKTYPAASGAQGCAPDSGGPGDSGAQGCAPDGPPDEKGGQKVGQKGGRKRRRGGPAVPDGHPFADLLHKVQALSASFTTALKNDASGRLLKYLLAVQGQRPKCPPLVWNRMLKVGDKEYGPQFTFLRSLYRLVKLAGLSGTRRDATLLKEFVAASDPTADLDGGAA